MVVSVVVSARGRAWAMVEIARERGGLGWLSRGGGGGGGEIKRPGGAWRQGNDLDTHSSSFAPFFRILRSLSIHSCSLAYASAGLMATSSESWV